MLVDLHHTALQHSECIFSPLLLFNNEKPLGHYRLMIKERKKIKLRPPGPRNILRAPPRSENNKSWPRKI